MHLQHKGGKVSTRVQGVNLCHEVTPEASVFSGGPAVVAHLLLHTRVKLHNTKVEKLAWEVDDEIARMLDHPVHWDAVRLQLLWLDQHCLKHGMTGSEGHAANT